MNVELAKIREINGFGEEFDEAPKRLEINDLKLKMYDLNSNLSLLYHKDLKNSAKIEDYIDAFVKNIYIVLEIFDKMNIYPDYFFDVTFLYNIDYQKYAMNNKGKTDDQLRKTFTPISNYCEKMRLGLENGYNKAKALQKRDLNDYFVEVASYYHAFSKPINHPKDIKKIFERAFIAHTNTMSNYYNSDYIDEDVGYLAELLFNYLSFFVEIGVNPKEYLDKYIELKKEKGHSK